MTEREGYPVNSNQVRRLMRLMEPTCHISTASPPEKAATHPICPYLLRDLMVDRPNQIWPTDVTYIPEAGRYLYLCAAVDTHSRMAHAWEPSNTLDASFCVRVVHTVMARAPRKSSTPTKVASLPVPNSCSRYWQPKKSPAGAIQPERDVKLAIDTSRTTTFTPTSWP